MKKVIVIGSPGAGKSTFSRRLRNKTGLPLYYLDMLWHKPDQTNVTREEFDACLTDIIQRDQWIVDGNYQRTLERRLEACDTVFFLDIPPEDCIAGVQARIGRKREDMPWIEDAFDEEFRQYIMKFPQSCRPEMCELLGKYQNKKEIITFKSRKAAEEYNILKSENTLR